MRRSKLHSRLRRFALDVWKHTPFLKMLALLIITWLAFSAGLYYFDRHSNGSFLNSYGHALYWGVAAFSTAGIAETPKSGAAQLVGGLWIVLGSTLFFGTIVATVTTYFMRPMQRPAKRIIDTIEYNLEQLDDLSIEELDLLRQTVDTLIAHVEDLKKKQAKREEKEKVKENEKEKAKTKTKAKT